MSATPGPERNEALICTATVQRTGARCRAFRAAGSDRCRLHGPHAAEEQAVRHRRKAEVRTQAQEALVEEAGRLRLDTPEAIARLLEETATKLRAGQIHAGAATALDRICRTALDAIRADQLKAATEEIAARRAAQGPTHRRRK